MARRRRGRHRKTGQRHPNGKLRQTPAVSPQEIAASQPHRRGLGELASDQKAETELGRLVLRGTLTPDQGLAGETYRSLWQGYVYSLGPPQGLSNGHGPNYSCDGCPDVAARKYCRCWFRKQIYLEARGVLCNAGHQTAYAVDHTVVYDHPPADIGSLRHALDVLACHFGLTTHRKIGYRKLASENASPAL